jgi:hypothetical protein
VALGEIGSDADIVFAGDVDDVFERLDNVIQRRFIPVAQERGKSGHTDEAAAICHCLELFIRFIPGVHLEPAWQAV